MKNVFNATQHLNARGTKIKIRYAYSINIEHQSQNISDGVLEYCVRTRVQLF